MSVPGLEPLPTWNAPGYGRPRNGLGIAALVVGLLALVTAVTVVIGIPLGLVALGLGIAGRVRAKRGIATNGGVALAGAILGLVAVLGAVALSTAIFTTSKKLSAEYEECRTRATSDEERAECTRRFEGDEP